MSPMVDEKNIPRDLENTVIRICPACGVVNPAGPSEACAHLQLARFDGMNEELSTLLGEVAEARNAFAKMASKLKEKVKQSLRDHEAEIETTWQAKPDQDEQLSVRRGSPKRVLSLESPPAPKAKPRKITKKRPRGPISVNPRQLELIAREPAKGDA